MCFHREIIENRNIFEFEPQRDNYRNYILSKNSLEFENSQTVILPFKNLVDSCLSHELKNRPSSQQISAFIEQKEIFIPSEFKKQNRPTEPNPKDNIFSKANNGNLPPEKFELGFEGEQHLLSVFAEATHLIFPVSLHHIVSKSNLRYLKNFYEENKNRIDINEKDAHGRVFFFIGRKILF